MRTLAPQVLKPPWAKKAAWSSRADTGQGGADEGPQEDGDQRRPAGMGAGAGKCRQGDEGDKEDEGATHAYQGLFVREAGGKLLHAPALPKPMRASPTTVYAAAGAPVMIPSVMCMVFSGSGENIYRQGEKLLAGDT